MIQKWSIISTCVPPMPLEFQFKKDLSLLWVKCPILLKLILLFKHLNSRFPIHLTYSLLAKWYMYIRQTMLSTSLINCCDVDFTPGSLVSYVPSLLCSFIALLSWVYPALITLLGIWMSGGVESEGVFSVFFKFLSSRSFVKSRWL